MSREGCSGTSRPLSLQVNVSKLFDKRHYANPFDVFNSITFGAPRKVLVALKHVFLHGDQASANGLQWPGCTPRDWPLTGRAARPSPISATATGSIRMSKQATIVLVHGFWGGAAHWSRVILALRRAGHTAIRAVELPLTSLADDAERTRKMVAQVAGPVLLVGHSYGGAVISVAGNAPNVAGLVYIAAFAPDAGESPGSLTQEHPPIGVPNLEGDSDGYLWVKPDKYHESFCQDLDAEEGAVLGVVQKAPLASTFGDTVGDPAWRHKPSWYQISSADRMISPVNQERMAARLQARKVITLDASHASLASRPAEVAALILEAARAVEA